MHVSSDLEGDQIAKVRVGGLSLLVGDGTLRIRYNAGSSSDSPATVASDP